MPVTFLAHQAPVLPLARRWPHAFDGVTLVIGSMAPDFAYVLNRSRFSLWAHSFPNVVLFCVPVTLVVSWIVVRVLAPVVPDQLPDLAPWHLHDYRGLATHRFRWVASPVSALIGALTHVVLDAFTHDWGWFARESEWYRAVIVDDFLGRTWTTFRLVQYAGHIVLTVLAIWLLARYGRQRWMLVRAARVRRPLVSAVTRTVLAACTICGFGAGATWVRADRAGFATDVLRVSAATFAGMCAGAIAVRSMSARTQGTRVSVSA